MRNLKPQTFLLALFLGLSAFGCGRGTEETDSDRIAVEQEQGRLEDEVATGDPEIQPEQVVVVEPESGGAPGADLDEREQQLADRRADLDAREQRLREQELNQRDARLRQREQEVRARREQPEPERQARAPQPQPQPQPQPRVEEREGPVETEDVGEVSGGDVRDDRQAERDRRDRDAEREQAEIEQERQAREREAEERTERPAPLVVSVPAGTVMEVEILKGLSSQTSEPGDIFRARVASDVSTDGAVGIPAGSEVVGVVSEAVPLRKVGGQAKLTLKFTDLVLPSGKTVPIQASLVQQGRSETRKDAATIGGAAAGGAVLGRVLNKKDRSKGAVIGAIIGAAAGAAIASRTPGEEVVIPEGTRLDLKLDDEIEVRPRR